MVAEKLTAPVRAGDRVANGARSIRRYHARERHMKHTTRILSGFLLTAAAGIASAQIIGGELEPLPIATFDQVAVNEAQSPIAAKIAGQYAHLAGSEDNALALVKALHLGAPVKLTAPDGASGGESPEVTTIEPPTGKMGWGDVKFALVIVQGVLYRAGITRPTGEQLQAALTGGDVTKSDGTVVTLKGVLQMRADGMGWKQIATNTKGKSG
jgi:hypothetical protein